MQIVCGFDVHKDSVFVCISNDNGDKFEARYGVLTLFGERAVQHSLFFYNSIVYTSRKA